jgi:hypothetical protein
LRSLPRILPRRTIQSELNNHDLPFDGMPLAHLLNMPTRDSNCHHSLTHLSLLFRLRASLGAGALGRSQQESHSLGGGAPQSEALTGTDSNRHERHHLPTIAGTHTILTSGNAIGVLKCSMETETAVSSTVMKSRFFV